ncbi:MAG: aminoglycoside phosphotransferase family protein [Devosia sp.]|nr:aminoglycoside phosphotransferase family protein [Devosia sp.]
MSRELPSEQVACEIAEREVGWAAATARRFTTGMAFFVYEVTSGTHQAVVRIGLPEQASVLQQGLRLSVQLKPLGVPLPEILGHGHHADFPYVSMTRLPGNDLGHVLHLLSTAQLGQIASAVADAQTATARLGCATGFGYASTAAEAPYARWTDVVGAHIERSQQRIASNGLFPNSVLDHVKLTMSAFVARLDVIKPTPFLHDTTTKNVIVSTEGYLSGIVDVDDLCYGDSRYPAALTAAALLNSGGPIDYVSAWLARAGQAWDGLFEFYVATFLLDFMSEHGMSFNGNEVASLAQDRERLDRLFQEAVSRADAEI